MTHLMHTHAIRRHYNYTSLLQAFRQRFSLSDLDLWREASAVWSRQQSSTEFIDAYITDIQNAAKVNLLQDPTRVRFVIIRSLKPAIQLHVL